MWVELQPERPEVSTYRQPMDWFKESHTSTVKLFTKKTGMHMPVSLKANLFALVRFPLRSEDTLVSHLSRSFCDAEAAARLRTPESSDRTMSRYQCYLG